MDQINFSDIETISDIIYFLNSSLVLKINVKLAAKNSYNERHSSITGSLYSADKYKSSPTLLSIKRKFDYYLSIESCGAEWNPNMYVQFKMGDMVDLLAACAKIDLQLRSNKIWRSKNNEPYLIANPDPIYLYNLSPSGITIRFRVLPIYTEDNILTKGVELIIKDERNCSYISQHNFETLCYILKTLDIYGTACSMVNSIPQIYQETQFINNLVSYTNKDAKEDTPQNKAPKRLPPGVKKNNLLE